jgi:hypothetical protein
MPSYDQKQRKPRFEYKERSVESLKQRAERTGGKFDSIYKGGYDTWKPRQGDNLIRFLPPTWDNADHYGYTIWTHGFVGPEQGSYLCLYKMQGKPCPICEASNAARQAGDEEEQKHLTATERILTWVLNRDGEDPAKPLLFQMSRTQDRDILALCHNRRTRAVLWIDNPDVGYDVTFQRTGTALNTRYFGYQIARDASPLNNDVRVQNGILEFISDNPLDAVLQFYPADYIRKALMGPGPVADDTGKELLRGATPADDPYEEDGTTTTVDDPPDELALDDDDTFDAPAPRQPQQPRPRATLRTR